MVDDAGYVYVSDLGNGRIAIFNQLGKLQASLHVGQLLNGIDVQPGTTWGSPGTVAVVAGNEANGQTSLMFFSTGGADQGQLIGSFVAPTVDTANGSLIRSTGLAYDGPNRLVVADYGASRVKVFQTDARGRVQGPAVELLVFGRPANFADPLESDLQSPFSITIEPVAAIWSATPTISGWPSINPISQPPPPPRSTCSN